MTRGQVGRPRSSTSVSSASHRPRPISRASTTSVNTIGAQPAQLAQHYRHQSETAFVPAGHPAHTQPLNTLEELITHTVANSAQPHQIDPLLQGHAGHVDLMGNAPGYGEIPDTSRPALNQFQSFDGSENQAFINVTEQNLEGSAGVADAPKKPATKGNASSQANDQELRRLFRENNHRDLKEVAASVIANERGPKSEKTKQIFAMNWLSITCKTSNSAVPRSVVYSHYVNRCGTEIVPVLNPASFGKLVRIIFPNVQTRRLGMRGASKYHYVDLAMIPEQIEEQKGDGNHGTGGLNGRNNNPAVWRSQLPADTAVFPSPNIPFDPNFSQPSQRPKMDAVGLVYLDHQQPNIHQGPSRPNMVRRMLQFPSYNVFDESEAQDDSPIELPSLDRYLPDGTDTDAATALRALYRTHCISLIDNFRHCKEKTFWRHFTSFHGTLTVPVQKLFSHPDIAPWIKECDWLMYQKMIRFASPRALEFLPDRAMDSFHSIAKNLGPFIQNVFANHPQHVRDARYGPAVIFAGLLDRLLRLQRASIRAIETLSNNASRDQMWYDWTYIVDPALVAETCLPGTGYTRTIQILTNDVRELLGPLGSISHPGMQRIYANAVADDNNQFPHFPDLDDSPSGSVLERWAFFLQNLSSRFPGADPRMLLHCVNAVGGAALRDLTLANAESFGHWAITKCWIDETMQWLAEVGGFLENGPNSIEMRPQKRSAREAGFDLDGGYEVYGGSRPRTSGSDANDMPSRYGSVDIRNDFSREQTVNRQAHNDDYHRQQAHTQSTGFAPPGNGPNMGYNQFLSNQQRNPSQRPSTQDQGYGELQSGQDGQYQQPTNRNNGVYHDSSTVAPSNPPKDEDVDQHDDSGIGLDFDLPQQITPSKLNDYPGFVTANSNGGSDPADVVVC